MDKKYWLIISIVFISLTLTAFRIIDSPDAGPVRLPPATSSPTPSPVSILAPLPTATPTPTPAIATAS